MPGTREPFESFWQHAINQAMLGQMARYTHASAADLPVVTQHDLENASRVRRGPWGSHANPAPVAPADEADARLKAQGKKLPGAYTMDARAFEKGDTFEQFTPDLPVGDVMLGLHGMHGDAVHRGAPLVMDQRPYAVAMAQDVEPGTDYDEAVSNAARADRGLAPVYAGLITPELFKDQSQVGALEILAAQLRANRRKYLGYTDPEFVAAQPTY